jgi:hypothetical protein
MKSKLLKSGNFHPRYRDVGVSLISKIVFWYVRGCGGFSPCGSRALTGNFLSGIKPILLIPESMFFMPPKNRKCTV